MKKCISCKEKKSLVEFYKSNKIYYQKECKQCQSNRKSKWYKTASGKESSRRTKLKQRFGISVEDYNILLDSQNYSCKICKEKESYLGHRLSVDHCHTTGKIRGLLCKSCNLGLGNFRDRIDLLEEAKNYLTNAYR